MYELGIGVAFLFWLWSAIYLMVLLNSKLERNLRKIGMRLSWTTLQPKQMTSADRDRTKAAATVRFAIIFGLSLPLILLSWLYVAWPVSMLVYRMSKNAGKPVVAREFEWKMRNLDLDFEQIAREMYNMHSVLGLQQPEFARFREDLWNVSAQP